MVILATLLGALLAAATPELGEPTFSRAYLRPDGLCFDSPVALDWEAMARREFKTFALDNPPRDQLLSSMRMGDPTFTYSADLPDTLTHLHFYLIAETGPQPVVPERLLGTIRYRFQPPANPELDVFSGEICLPVPKAIDDAGFVATSSVPLSWQQTPATLVRSDSTTLVRLQSGSSAALPAPGFDGGAVEVKTAYILSSTELATKYVFIRRMADCPRVCCEFTYDIYRWESGLPVVASNAYGCDI